MGKTGAPRKNPHGHRESILVVAGAQTQDLLAVRQLMLITTPSCHRLIGWSD